LLIFSYFASVGVATAFEMAQTFVGIFKPLGFHYVTIDLEGYRQGSMNSVLKK